MERPQDRDDYSDESAAGRDGRPPRLATRALTVKVGRKTLVRPTDLTLYPGEWKALVGPNGAGKTSLLKAVATLIPSYGDLLHEGESVSKNPARYRGRLGVVMHESLLYRELTAHENLVLFARLYAVPESKALEQLKKVGLAAVADERVGRFSRGMLQRLSVARALLHDPDILLLDEPLVGIDARGAAGILELFRRARESRKSALWVTHRWERAWDLVDEVLEVDHGRIVSVVRTADVDPGEWQPAHAAAEVNRS